MRTDEMRSSVCMTAAMIAVLYGSVYRFRLQRSVTTAAALQQEVLLVMLSHVPIPL